MIIVTSLVMVNASIVIILCKLINEKYRSKDCFCNAAFLFNIF